MKKPIILLIAFCLTIGSTFAQNLTGSLTNGIIANYNSENGRNASYDASGNNRNLTAVNGASLSFSVPSGNPPLGASLYTGANQSRGSKSLFQYQNTNSTLMLSDYTVSLWFQAPSFSNGTTNNFTEWNYLFSSGNAAFMRIGTDTSDAINFGKFFFNYNGGNANVSSLLQENTWLNLTVTQSAGFANIYFNGTNISSTYSATPHQINANDYNVGGAYNVQYNHAGVIGDVVIYDRGLSTNEVVDLVKAVPEPSTYALIGLGSLALIVAYRRKVA